MVLFTLLFAAIGDVELREIPMQDGRWVMSGAEVALRCDDNTIGVVCTLGVTFTGQCVYLLDLQS